MIKIKRIRILLGILSFVLVLIGLYLLYLPKEKEVESTITQRPITQDQTPVLNLPPTTLDNELPVFRNLFEPRIKPSLKTPIENRPTFTKIQIPSPKIEQVPPPPLTSSSFKLVGIVMGSPPIAVLEEPLDGTSHIVKEGDVVNGEEIIAIREDSVRIRKNGQELTLILWEG